MFAFTNPNCRCAIVEKPLTYITDSKRHLICTPYSIANLHKMAGELNINQCWFHGGRFPHYDIPKLRQQEIRSKCKIVSSRELLQTIKDARNGLDD